MLYGRGYFNRKGYFSCMKMGKSHLELKMTNSLVSETNLEGHLSVLHQGVSGGLTELDTCPQMERYINIVNAKLCFPFSGTSLPPPSCIVRSFPALSCPFLLPFPALSCLSCPLLTFPALFCSSFLWKQVTEEKIIVSYLQMDWYGLTHPCLPFPGFLHFSPFPPLFFLSSTVLPIPRLPFCSPREGGGGGYWATTLA